MGYKKTGNIGDSCMKALANVLMLLFSLSCIFPIVWLFLSSLKTQNEFMKSSMALPEAFNLKNYISVFTETNMLLYIWNSLRNTLLFPYIAFGLPISVMLIESYVSSIPKELEEAAAIDGCGFFKTIFQIMLLYFVFSKRIIESMVAGAVKG